ncbi:MAG: 30S ribosomal protein S12 methylthiotransferase RimO [Gemmatimonadota bacterium]
MKLGLVSLGCDKNTVDSERILAALSAYGAERASTLQEAEVVVVNTCGFIDAAKRESIETILEAARLKGEGNCRAVVAVGCLVERHREELAASLPEVDLFLGLRDLDRLVPELQQRGLLGERRRHPGDRLPLGSDRHVRYLKVSEGCDHGCAFCAIPLWRGRHRSFDPDRLVAEARRLEAQGVVELNLVAQDLAHYGREFRDGTDIAALLSRLLEETDIPWFRLLYVYSAGLREPLVELMASEERVLSYIDMPIQHASDSVLKRMRRPERQKTLRRKLTWLRDAIPDLTLRTTVLVGFPGETDEDFRKLLDFLEDARFDRLGAFAFSPQEGTRAMDLQDLFVSESVARARLEELLEVQRAISAERLAREVGRRRRAIVGSRSENGAGPTGRLESQADDVDGITVLQADAPLRDGQIVEVEVTHADDFDLTARVLRVLREPAVTRRKLPIAAFGLETAWGR